MTAQAAPQAKRIEFELSAAERRELGQLLPVEGIAWRWWTEWARKRGVSLRSISCEQQLGRVRVTALPLGHDAPHEMWPAQARCPKRPEQIPEISRFLS